MNEYLIAFGLPALAMLFAASVTWLVCYIFHQEELSRVHREHLQFLLELKHSLGPDGDPFTPAGPKLSLILGSKTERPN